MTTTTLTPEQKQTLAHLVCLRHAARIQIQNQAINRENIATWEAAHRDAIDTGDLDGEALAKIRLDRAKETGLELKFKIIEIGNAFIGASSHYDQLPREVWLRALCVNESEWDSPDMLMYGNTIRNVVNVLDLENSATNDDATIIKPLKWCTIVAMMNAMETNLKLGRLIHDATNEFFGGEVFGEYREPTMLEQMGVR